MTDKKWYSVEDIELAKSALSEMPDLTPTRLTKSDVLEQLKEQIVELSLKKGYSVEDIRSALDSAGIKTSAKSVRDVLNSARKSPSRTTRSRKSGTEASDRPVQKSQ
ncbi:molybdopterin-guanine dinucleotide biosynthesis protein MobC [Salmonella enterica subsp. diarizonae]|uniref:Molybdopterin-guanine dinucleotide biosynthesis protein MobC n=1 Tax=Salmonella diarizonae TaxID=59204 RepID=A0A5Y3W8L4_SALDZ|nr:molybdopterin-guanine dinucleotide biosynthesis protein MobC [Salmonella enterica subsp. diarizonae]ECJ4380036.1 molybdopterin-guanine dinucleotide biosynthesis protein MobC [Salmonella enterica subsp. diarizonae]HBM0248248.1 molybdopterin-guanine dinucleotide biosynthesis protein MobC [Salmonella enterica]HBM0507556.1 molybdopterin-guanine dinucleotide biosynthesis protein MobC [Salmonella enterica]